MVIVVLVLLVSEEEQGFLREVQSDRVFSPDE